MVSLAARTTHTLSQSWFTAVAEIRTRVGGLLSSSVLQFRNYSDEGLEGGVPRTPEASSSEDPLLIDTSFSGNFPLDVPNTQTFGADRLLYRRNSDSLRKWEGFRVSGTYDRNSAPLRKPEGFRVYGSYDRNSDSLLKSEGFVVYGPYDRNSGSLRRHEGFSVYGTYDRNSDSLRRWEEFSVYGTYDRNSDSLRRWKGIRVCGTYDRNSDSLRKWEGFRVYGKPRGVHIAIWKPQLTRTAWKEQKRSIGKYLRAYGNETQELCPQTPRQGLVRGKELPTGYGGGNIHRSSASNMSIDMDVLKHRQQQGLYINSFMFVEILKRCSAQKDLVAARQVHEYVIRSGMDKHPYVASSLQQTYIKCGRLQDARRVFDGLERTDRNVITWTVMISAYAQSGLGAEAYQLFLQMKREGFIADAVTYVSLLNASAASVGALEWVKEVHCHALKAGLLDSDLRVANVLVHMYAKSGSITDARLVFDRMEKRNVITWNTIIGAYAESGCGVEAYRLFLQMEREGFIPNAITYTSILNASSGGSLEWVRQVHGHAVKARLDLDLRVANALVHMYAKSGSIADARLLFDRMEKRNVISWNIMIGAYAESGFGVEAYALLLQMKQEGFIADAITYMSILNASASAGALEWVKEVHGHVVKAGLESDLRVANALLHMYAKSGSMADAQLVFDGMEKHDVITGNTMIEAYATSGSIDDARLIFDTMEKRDVVTWTTMIGGLAQHGCGPEALKLFREMNADGVKPNGISFVAVLSACCHSGLLDDGRRLFSAMTRDYGIEPTVVHHNCMVDLLGRAGHLEEASVYIGDMPVEPDGVTWHALLGACRTYGNVELGELAARQLLTLEPKNASAYVLLSNIYAAAGQWEKVSMVRATMHERGVRKEPGRSLIVVDNKVHEFVAGGASHPEAKAIYALLNKLTEEMKAEGYIPDTKLVLQNMEEEDKELMLCSHSEKLAIAYGLLRTPRGKPICVYKNLRVCSDCHTATKFISKITGREILARDANRFHHFKDGRCSCGDYW